jgi:hypothetical protein
MQLLCYFSTCPILLQYISGIYYHQQIYAFFLRLFHCISNRISRVNALLFPNQSWFFKYLLTCGIQSTALDCLGMGTSYTVLCCSYIGVCVQLMHMYCGGSHMGTSYTVLCCSYIGLCTVNAHVLWWQPHIIPSISLRCWVVHVFTVYMDVIVTSCYELTNNSVEQIKSFICTHRQRWERQQEILDICKLLLIVTYRCMTYLMFTLYSWNF